jgi:hypothetical protein
LAFASTSRARGTDTVIGPKVPISCRSRFTALQAPAAPGKGGAVWVSAPASVL